MLEIRDLHVSIGDKPILKGISLAIRPGEVHAIMGPNGSGKSTLAQVLAGREGYTVTAGTVTWQGQDLMALTPEERAWAGLFLGFQYPLEIPGVANVQLLKEAVNSQRRRKGLPELDAFDFLERVKRASSPWRWTTPCYTAASTRASPGGEKKRNEILQMLMLEPRLAVLDETDSGLDIDALKIVARGVNALRSPERAILLVTHYQRLLDHITPDHVHVLADGRILASGGRELALELEAKGYGWLTEPSSPAPLPQAGEGRGEAGREARP